MVICTVSAHLARPTLRQSLVMMLTSDGTTRITLVGTTVAEVIRKHDELAANHPGWKFGAIEIGNCKQTDDPTAAAIWR